MIKLRNLRWVVDNPGELFPDMVKKVIARGAGLDGYKVAGFEDAGGGHEPSNVSNL